MRIWVLLHIGGFVFWMGGAFASMLIGIRGRSEDRATQAAVTRLQAALLRNLVAPGAAVAVASGLYLSALTMKANPTPSVWLILMQGAGIIAALLSSQRNAPLPHDLALFGEVGLLGEIRSVSQPELRAREAAALGFRRVIVPHSNAAEVRADIEVIAVRRMEDFVTALLP